MQGRGRAKPSGATKLAAQAAAKRKAVRSTGVPSRPDPHLCCTTEGKRGKKRNIPVTFFQNKRNSPEGFTTLQIHFEAVNISISIMISVG